MGSVLLVTGSRSLARGVGQAWAWRILEDALDSLPPGSLVVTGDAEGPDLVARWLAAGCLRPVWHFDLDGLRRFEHDEEQVKSVRWGTPPPAGSPERKRWPLERNRAMVAWVAAQPGERACLALIDPGSRTHGTEYTAREAERAGIAVRREVFR